MGGSEQANLKYNGFIFEIKRILHGTVIAMYSVGQERRLVDPPSQVVAGVRTVTTNMDGRDALPRMSRPFAFIAEEMPATNGT